MTIAARQDADRRMAEADAVHFWSWQAGQDARAPHAAPASSPTMTQQITFITGVNPDGTVTDTSFWGSRGATAFKWGEPVAGTGATIAYGYAAEANFRANEKATFEKALAMWSSVADVTFVAADDPGSAEVLLVRGRDRGAYSTQFTSVGSGSTLGGVDGQAIISIDTRVPGFDLSGSFAKVGGYGLATVIHEIGHMLGLGHGGAYNGGANPSTDQYSAYDDRMYTTMSYIAWYQNDALYRTANPVTGTDWGLTDDGYYRAAPHSIMMLDILAIQQLYGVAETTPFDGGQVYGFRSNIEGPLRDLYNFARNDAPVVTIYNQGTGNMLNLSGYEMAQVIDLHPGAFSSIGGLTNNLAIALGTVIEAAIGGSGNDVIIASDVDSRLSGGGGDDILSGGAGRDVLIGGGGADQFAFLAPEHTQRTANLADTIRDFSRADGDLIFLSDLDAKAGGKDDAFTFIGSAAFSGTAGELRVDHRATYALVIGDLDGDARSDFAIRVDGAAPLEARDFLL